MPLTPDQTQVIIITERASSVLSLCGAALVIFTFLMSSKFRKPINRLVFYATWGNVLSNVATLMSTSGIEAGQSSSLCQVQAFLIQWFMPADALWTFAMACNVYLSFFKSCDSNYLRKLEWKYVVACYGIPFIPACVFLFIQSVSRGKIYGSATLWCWVSLEWEPLRVATFYGPVWLVILTTFAIYIKVGAVIFRWRKGLMDMEICSNSPNTIKSRASFINTKDTDILVQRSYTVTRPNMDPNTVSTIMSHHIAPFSRNRACIKEGDSPYTRVQRSGGIDPNKATLKYCKCAILFFIALLITWVPSTINRIWTLVYPDDTVFGINFAAALVLPLQGFWNAVVYFATSVYAIQSLWLDFRGLLNMQRPIHPSIDSVQRTGTTMQDSHLAHIRNAPSCHVIRSSSQKGLVGDA